MTVSFPNVLVTGHQGFFTIEAMREIAETTLLKATCFLREIPCPNLIPGLASPLSQGETRLV